MIYGSVCSGIEAASVGWAPLGWSAAFVSEIDKFPCAVLAHRFPDVPLHGDFTTIEENQYEPIDLLVGGTPCQSFSIAGLRGGLDDDRGNLGRGVERTGETRGQRGKDADACPDGPRYKALGNSMAVNVMRWIGQRIDAVENL